MRKIALALPLAGLFLLFGCTAEKLSGEISSPLGASTDKIVNTRSGALDDVLLVKLGEGCDPSQLESVEGVHSVSRAFQPVEGKEELESRFGFDRWYLVPVADGEDIEALAGRISAVTDVCSVEYNSVYTKASDGIVYPYEPSESPRIALSAASASGSSFNDPYLSDQWHYINNGNASVATSVYKGADINVKDVWSSLTTGDSSIIVAVVDEGVKYTHPDLAANMWTNPKGTEDLHGWNFVDDGPISWDAASDSGHGTHCAGTIAAVNNNGIGVCGVAGGSGNGDGVKIMSCQIFDNDRGGSSYIVAKAIKYAADNGASIISCSFGYTGGAYLSDKAYRNGNSGRNTLEYDAIKYFEATKNNDVVDGGIAIFAAGNDGDPYATYPGALNDVISVSAFGPDFLPAYYTNYGPGCNIVAPGGEAYLSPWTTRKGLVLSTIPSELYDGSEYGYMQGTSMACPHVSGVVALGLSYAKKLGKHYSVKEFKEMILASANDFETKLASAGTKDYVSGAPVSISLADYRKQMGTGSIDTWRLMMKIEGTPCLIAAAGQNQWLDLSEYFGTASVNLTYLDIEYTDEAAEAIGLAEEPYIKYGRLYIHPTKCGSAKFTINAVGGGTAVGGDDAIGGMAIHQDVSVIVRSVKSKNGGWL